jgi:MFS family permease
MEKVATLENYQSETIEWKQLISLAGLYSFVIIGWIAYHNYQPKLLVKFDFTQFTSALLIAQGIILVLTPPIAGRLGDRFRFQRGHRMPIISSGISFAAMIFMAVAFALFSSPGETFKWILPILIILWLIAMSIFTSPALSTLELFTPIEKLPRAMALLTIVSNLIYSLEPVIVDIIDYIGAPLTFIVGGAGVFLSGYSLRKNSLNLFGQKKTGTQATFTFDTQRSQYGTILALGLGLGVVTTLLFNFVPERLEMSLDGWFGLSGKSMLVLVLVASALLSMPASNWIMKQGLIKSYRYSLITSLVSGAILMLVVNAPIALFATVVYAISFTVLSVSGLPLAINKANYFEKVYCVGFFFSGVAIPEAILKIVQSI